MTNLSQAEQADIIAAMTIDAVAGSAKPFDARLHEIRPFAGNKLVAARILKLLEGSQINASHLNCKKVQDPYSLRCVPAVHGAVKDVLQQTVKTLTVESNSSTDNPLVFADEDKILSCGNFHGQPVSFALDFRSC